MHTSRANRKANKAKKLKKKRECRPLTPDEIKEQADKNREAHRQRYPYAPVYAQPKFGIKGKI